ncbi:MAG: O-methyltransferase [Candidatus Eisenbacteria bacterium]|uniref:O-methyltransferase n=1 Tax=Eiseniibacteriota bacterium TaxID=2212470 RepID=A0A933SE17_UNCEI|nr:O-methyltransferase [Candidatus Eisenbacteria bacterium]
MRDTVLWAAVDDYIEEQLVPEEDGMQEVLAACDAGGLPAIAVSTAQGKLLHLLARMHGAKRVLEVGTLGGYSTIWLARALPEGGRVVTLELDAKHAAVARANFARAGLAHAIELREGPAADSLAALHAEGAEPFDFVFIDADKPGNPVYVDWALKLLRDGGVLVLDNVVREGGVIDAASENSAVLGTRAAIERLSREPRVSATAIQTVGAKGYDGFLLALVRG